MAAKTVQTKAKPAKATKAPTAQSTPETVIAIHQKQLLESLQAIAPAIDGKNVIPALEYALFEVTETGARVTATNLDLYITETLRTEETRGEGKFLLPLRRLLNFTAKSDGNISITWDGKQSFLTCGHAAVKWAVHPLEDFPAIPGEPKQMTALTSAPLARALKAIANCVTEDESQYTFNALSFLITKERMRLATSDGYRLGYVEMERPANANEFEALVPRKAINPLVRLTEEEEIFYGEQGNFFIARSNGRRIATRLISGTFPNVETMRQVTNKNPVELAINSFALGQALARVTAACEEGRESGIVLKVTKNRLRLELDRRNYQIGIATDVVNVEYEGEPFDFAINHKFLSHALSIGETIVLKFKSPQSPLQFYAQDDSRILHVIAPLDVEGARRRQEEARQRVEAEKQAAEEEAQQKKKAA